MSHTWRNGGDDRRDDRRYYRGREDHRRRSPTPLYEDRRGEAPPRRDGEDHYHRAPPFDDRRESDRRWDGGDRYDRGGPRARSRFTHDLGEFHIGRRALFGSAITQCDHSAALSAEASREGALSELSLGTQWSQRAQEATDGGTVAWLAPSQLVLNKEGEIGAESEEGKFEAALTVPPRSRLHTASSRRGSTYDGGPLLCVQLINNLYSE